MCIKFHQNQNFPESFIEIWISSRVQKVQVTRADPLTFDSWQHWSGAEAGRPHPRSSRWHLCANSWTPWDDPIDWIDSDQDGIRGTGRPQQNMGIVTVRIASHAAGRDHRQHGNCGQSAEPAQRAHVSHLPGHVKENYDHQGVPASLLLRLYYYGFTEW